MGTPALLLPAPFPCTPKSLTHSFIWYIFMEGLLGENPALHSAGGRGEGLGEVYGGGSGDCGGGGDEPARQAHCSSGPHPRWGQRCIGAVGGSLGHWSSPWKLMVWSFLLGVAVGGEAPPASGSNVALPWSP